MNAHEQGAQSYAQRGTRPPARAGAPPSAHYACVGYSSRGNSNLFIVQKYATKPEEITDQICVTLEFGLQCQ